MEADRFRISCVARDACEIEQIHGTHDGISIAVCSGGIARINSLIFAVSGIPRRNSIMKRISSIIGAAVIALLMSAPAMAQGMIPNMSGMNVPQYSGVPWSSGMPNQKAFNEWANNHRKAAAELQANPGLMYDPSWRKHHKHFQHFIETHPEDWKALKQGGTRYYNSGFNNYLSRNPSAAAQLRQNPELLYNPAFRKANPGLTSYMQSHPNVWQSTPYQRHHGEEMGETPAQEQAEHHGKHWRHEQEKAEHHAKHQQNWQQQHPGND
jgi:hypothetical protein